MLAVLGLAGSMRKKWKKLEAASAAIFAVVFVSCGQELPDGSVTEPKAARSQALQVPGLQAEYFDDDALQDLGTTRIDPQVDFFWGSGMPSGTALSSADTFSQCALVGNADCASDRIVYFYHVD